MADKIASRRKFIKQTSLAGASIMFVPNVLNASPGLLLPGNDEDLFTFLFQGDSITDGNRSRNMDWNHVLGHGYAYLIAARLWYDLPKKNLHFFNRGVSGNKITDLAQRWQDDTIVIKPNLLSILIGINDTVAAINGDQNFTTLSFENSYRNLLTQTRQQLPDVVLVICEPFILKVGKVKDEWDKYQNEIVGRQKVAKLIAEEFNAIYIPLQDAFNRALDKAPAAHWIWDGVHPMPGGHELIAREWLKVVGGKIKVIK